MYPSNIGIFPPLDDGDHSMTFVSGLVSHASSYRVVVGEYNLFENEGSEQYIAVERITVHPSWNGELGLG